MPKIAVKKLSGEKSGDLSLKEEIFGVEKKDALIHQVYLAQSANRRTNLSHAKTRAERRGSTRKPWRQKGTGRARVGTVRNPVWRKGGVAHGPKSERNYKQKINSKMNNAAIRMVLSGKVKDQELVVLENYDFADIKTKRALEVLKNLKVDKSVLWSFLEAEKEKEKACRNLDKVMNTRVESLNVFDMLNQKYLLITKAGIKRLEEKYGKKEEKKGDSKEESVEEQEKLKK